MDKMTSYAEVLLRNGLNINKKDSLFISIPSTSSELAIALINQAKKIGIDDLYVYYNDISSKDNHLTDYITKRAKFLFFTSGNDDSLNMNMIYDLVNNDVDLKYTIALLPNSNNLSIDDIFYYSSMDENNPLGTCKKSNSNNDRIVSQIKNFKLNKMKIESLKDTCLTMDLNGEVLGNSNLKGMRFFPNYKVELIVKPESTEGFITAGTTTFKNSVIEELRLSIKKGKVVDYDCATSFVSAKEILDLSKKPTVEAVGLISSDSPTYMKYGVHNNLVLDRTSSPYILISSYDEKNDEKGYLVVPIGSGLLKVTGYNENSKAISLYEEENFSKKIIPKKK